MKFNVKALCSLGALVLCSENVSANTILHKTNGYGTVHFTGTIRKGDLPKSDPFVVIRSVIFKNNNLEKFTPEIENWLKKQTGLLSFSILNNKFEEFPVKILEWFPRLERIHFWGNPVKKDEYLSLLSYGNLETINVTSKACAYGRGDVNKTRQRIIDLYNEKIQSAENLLSEKRSEISSLQERLESLKEQKLNLKREKGSNRKKDFVRKAINKNVKALRQKEETYTNLQKEKETFEDILGKLENAQRKSLEIKEREDQYYRNRWR